MSDDRTNTRWAQARFDSYGGLQISGVDRGPMVERVWGSSEYEWSRRIELRHIKALRVALGCETDQQLTAAIASMTVDELLRVINDAEIPTTFFSWNSFD